MSKLQQRIDDAVKLAMDQDNMSYGVNEIFIAPQGEGLLTGVLSTFIRLQGCSVGCSWCDTKYTWSHAEMYKTVEEILAEVPTLHVVITGGEPLNWPLDPLLNMLHTEGHTTQIETSGQLKFKGNLRPTHVTCSPKEQLDFKIALPLGIIDEVKFVIDEPFEFRVLGEFMANKPSFIDMPVILMPEGTPPSEDMIKKTLDLLDHVEAHEWPNFRFGDRLQYRIGVK